MEDKSFLWLMSLMASKQASIPILDAYYINKGSPLAYFFYNAREEYSFELEGSSLADVISKVYREGMLIKKLGLGFKIFLFFEGNRMSTSLSKMKKMLETNQFPQTLKLIQFIKGPVQPPIVIAYSKRMFKSKVKASKAKSIAKSLVAMIEMLENRKVAKMLLEIVADSNGCYWISNVRELKLERIAKSCTLVSSSELFKSTITHSSRKHLKRNVNGYHSTLRGVLHARYPTEILSTSKIKSQTNNSLRIFR